MHPYATYLQDNFILIYINFPLLLPKHHAWIPWCDDLFIHFKCLLYMILRVWKSAFSLTRIKMCSILDPASANMNKSARVSWWRNILPFVLCTEYIFYTFFPQIKLPTSRCREIMWLGLVRVQLNIPKRNGACRKCSNKNQKDVDPEGV